MTMTSSQEAEALTTIQQLDSKKKEELKKGATAAYVTDVKQSMLFQPGFNWNDMLCAAPISVMLLGSLFIASTIPDALQIKVSPPTTGFVYLEYVSVHRQGQDTARLIQ